VGFLATANINKNNKHLNIMQGQYVKLVEELTSAKQSELSIEEQTIFFKGWLAARISDDKNYHKNPFEQIMSDFMEEVIDIYGEDAFNANAEKFNIALNDLKNKLKPMEIEPTEPEDEEGGDEDQETTEEELIEGEN
jgi:hypothetical protein